MMQSQKFEMLLDSGARALLQGFTLEACASFAAALERFYEFSLHVVCTGREMSSELLCGMLKPMLTQSQYQLGAFMLLHALEFGSAYELPKASIKGYKYAQFRNAVIHKGFIPNMEDAHKFGAKVYEEIYKLFERLSGKHAEGIQAVITEDLCRRRAKCPDNMMVSTSVGPNLFSMARQENSSSFDKAFASFSEADKSIGKLPEMMALPSALKAR